LATAKTKQESAAAAAEIPSDNPIERTKQNFVAYKPEENLPVSPIDFLVRKSDMRGQAITASLVKKWDALKVMWSGRLRKRDFIKSRWYRISRRVNPWSQCSSEEECLIELKEANADRVGLALKTEYGRHWYHKREAKEIFPRERGRSGSPY